jgi:hypothetical protein
LSSFIAAAIINDDNFVGITPLRKIAGDTGKIRKKAVLLVIRREDD